MKNEIWKFKKNESFSIDDIDDIHVNIDYDHGDDGGNDDGHWVQIKCIWLAIIYLVVCNVALLRTIHS